MVGLGSVPALGSGVSRRVATAITSAAAAARPTSHTRGVRDAPGFASAVLAAEASNEAFVPGALALAGAGLSGFAAVGGAVGGCAIVLGGVGATTPGARAARAVRTRASRSAGAT